MVWKLDNKYPYMPEESYWVVPAGAFEKDIEQETSDRYALLSDGMVVFFRKPFSKEVWERFVKDYEENLQKERSDPNIFRFV